MQVWEEPERVDCRIGNYCPRRSEHTVYRLTNCLQVGHGIFIKMYGGVKAVRANGVMILAIDRGM
jgi:hypothetical protein